MTETDKFAAQGRAHAELKSKKSQLATARAMMTSEIDWMHKTADLMKEFLRNPLAENYGGSLSRQLAFEASQTSTPETISSRVREIAELTERVRDLQAEVDRF